MWTLLLSPIGRRVGMSVGILLVAGLMLRWYGNRQYAAGQEKGRVEMTAKIQEAANAARDEIIKETDMERLALLEEQAQLEKQITDLSRQRGALQSTLNTRLASIDATLRKETIDVSAVAATDLPDRIRAANQLFRTRRGGGPPVPFPDPPGPAR